MSETPVHPIRVPRIGRTRLSAATRRMITEWMGEARLPGLLNPNIPLVKAELLWHALQPLLFDRHWTDKQVWYCLDWVQFDKYNQFRYPPMANDWQLQQGLITILREQGYQVEVPKPPQNNKSIIISWRAELYFNEE